MLRVDSWLDVASLKNVKEDHSFLFLKIFFFFWKNLEILNFSRNWKFWLILFFFEKFGSLEFFQGIENFDWFFFFFESNLRSMSPMPLVPRPFLKISFFFFFSFLFLERFRKNWFFFFWKFCLLSFFFFFGWNMKICSLSKSE